MGLALSPRFEDIFEEPFKSPSELLRTIPSFAALSAIAGISAQIDKNWEQQDIFKFALRRNPQLVVPIFKKIISFENKVRHHAEPFNKYFLNILINTILKNYNSELRDLSPEEDLTFLKAYFAQVNKYLDAQEIILKEESQLNEDPFNRITWPIIAEQIQFQISPSEPFDTIRALCIVDELNKTGRKDYVDEFANKLKIKVTDYISNLIGIVQHQENLTVQGYTTPSFFTKIRPEHNQIFEGLTMDPARVTSEKNWDNNFLAIKKYPVLKFRESIFTILNRDFLKLKLYNGFIFDIFNKTKLKKEFKSFDNFKSFIGKEVTEKRIFQSLLKTLFESETNVLEFSEGDGHPDCYLRVDNKIILIEFKDYMMASNVISSNETQMIKAEIEKKFISNEKGKSKGIQQIINQIHLLENENFPFDNNLGRSAISDIIIYPVIIYTDYQYSIPGINNFLNAEMQKRLNTSKIKNVKPLTMINLSYLFDNMEYLFMNGIEELLNNFYSLIAVARENMIKAPSIQNWMEINQPFESAIGMLSIEDNNEEAVLGKFFDKLGLSTLTN